MKLFKRKSKYPGNHQIPIGIMSAFFVMIIASAILEISFLTAGEYICTGHVQSFFTMKIKLQISFLSRANYSCP